MKTLSFKVLTIVIIFFLNFNTLQAQFSIGTGISYPIESDQEQGLNIRLGSQFNDELKATIGYTYYPNSNTTLQFSSIIFDINYFFVKEEKVKGYALVGFNVTAAAYELHAPNIVSKGTI